ncbi:MAG: hypothetical protein M1830_009550 [Pleopsidium flavum]|nr:MAG: hypothetical protein M1830_009550 [Pleopsidium flavum]
MPNGPEVVEKLDWVVMDDKDTLEDAFRTREQGTNVQSSHFKHWVDAHGKSEGNGSRYETCLLIDSASLQSVLNAPLLGSFDFHYNDATAYVTVMDASFAADEEYDDASYPRWMKASVHKLGSLYLIMLEAGMDRWYPVEGVTWHEGWQMEEQAANIRALKEKNPSIRPRRYGWIV